ncbi:uncharacterized protein LOC113287189 isoform X2 [Papaver somniferum]|uniref:uncharacterized protein LOC113287189 isoform X2 n=1 Tax=Papaver somniferum TaxID=3469 RepID=UPI000E701E43|nr:uncharacterized protein LOC113287189 isoform X2 [Papaver somniferum]
MHQQTQSDDNVLDNKEYRQRVLEERQRQNQVFSEQPCTQYILGGSKARKYKTYNEKRKADRASKKEQVQKVKSTKQVSSTRSAAQKARREKELAEKEKEAADMRRMADADTVRKLNLVPKPSVRVQPETKHTRMRKVVEDPFGGQYEGDEPSYRVRYMGSDAACGDQVGMEDEVVNMHVDSKRTLMKTTMICLFRLRIRRPTITVTTMHQRIMNF